MPDDFDEAVKKIKRLIDKYGKDFVVQVFKTALVRSDERLEKFQKLRQKKRRQR